MSLALGRIQTIPFEKFEKQNNVMSVIGIYYAILNSVKTGYNSYMLLRNYYVYSEFANINTDLQKSFPFTETDHEKMTVFFRDLFTVIPFDMEPESDFYLFCNLLENHHGNAIGDLLKTQLEFLSLEEVVIELLPKLYSAIATYWLKPISVMKHKDTIILEQCKNTPLTLGNYLYMVKYGDKDATVG